MTFTAETAGASAQILLVFLLATMFLPYIKGWLRGDNLAAQVSFAAQVMIVIVVTMNAALVILSASLGGILGFIWILVNLAALSAASGALIGASILHAISREREKRRSKKKDD